MRKFFVLIISIMMPLIMIACGEMKKKDIELMGAGDRIHDSFTFANTGVSIKEKENNIYEISGEVDKIESDEIKKEFEIDEDINHVVVVKLSANGKTVDKNKVNIKVDGVRNYDAEHLNGSDYTFIILEAVKGKSVSISVKWDGESENNYVIQFSENLLLK